MDYDIVYAIGYLLAVIVLLYIIYVATMTSINLVREVLNERKPILVYIDPSNNIRITRV